MTTSNFTTEIRYNRKDRDFAVIVNGNIIGYASSRLEAESIADNYITEQLTSEARYAR